MKLRYPTFPYMVLRNSVITEKAVTAIHIQAITMRANEDMSFICTAPVKMPTAIIAAVISAAK